MCPQGTQENYKVVGSAGSDLRFHLLQKSEYHLAEYHPGSSTHHQESRVLEIRIPVRIRVSE